MSSPGSGGVNPMMYYPAIESASFAGSTTADVWAAIRQAATAAGRESPGITLAQVNAMRQSAVGTRNAAGRLNSADPTYGLNSAMIGTPSYARSQDERTASPMYQARFQHTTMVNGVAQTDWRSVTFRGALPATVGDLQAQVQRDAAQMAAEYNRAHVDVGSIQLLGI